jgi:pimeloyl-ACP methyl ester carboxylesterase
MKVSFPVLFIIGKQDKTFPVDKVMAQSLLPQHAEVLLLGNIAHMGMVEAPKETREMVESFSGRCFGA